MPPRVLVVGSINMDLIVRCRHMPRQGETIFGQDFGTAPGGKGANQAVACARLGAQTTMVGRVGEDAFGQTLLAGLAAGGIDVSRVKQEAGTSSGVALILLEQEGHNRIVVISGANARVGDEEVACAEELLGECDAVLMQFEIPLPVVNRVAAAARARGVRVVLDAGAATADVASSPVLAAADVVSPNESEAEVLTGVHIHSVEDGYTAAEALRGLGVREVVLKLGGAGALWVGEGGARHVPAFPIEPVDTTAAGDAFTAALTVSLAAGDTMEEAIRRGNAAGALACLRLGAQPSMPTAAEVEAFLQERE